MKTYKKPLTLMLFLLMAFNFSWQVFTGQNLEAQSVSFASEGTPKYSLDAKKLNRKDIKSVGFKITEAKIEGLDAGLQPVETDGFVITIEDFESTEAGNFCDECIIGSQITIAKNADADLLVELKQKVAMLLDDNKSNTNKASGTVQNCDPEDSINVFYACLDDKVSELESLKHKNRRDKNAPDYSTEIEEIKDLLAEDIAEIHDLLRDEELDRRERKELKNQLKALKKIKNRSLKKVVRDSIAMEKNTTAVYNSKLELSTNLRNIDQQIQYCESRQRSMGMISSQNPYLAQQQMALMYQCNTTAMKQQREQMLTSYRHEAEALPLYQNVSELKYAGVPQVESYLSHYNSLRALTQLPMVRESDLNINLSMPTRGNTIVANNQRFNYGSFYVNPNFNPGTITPTTPYRGSTVYR